MATPGLQNTGRFIQTCWVRALWLLLLGCTSPKRPEAGLQVGRSELKTGRAWYLEKKAQSES